MEENNFGLTTNQTIIEMIKLQRVENQKKNIVTIIAIVLMFLQTTFLVGGCLYFVNTFDIEATSETTTTTQEVNGENSKINNVDGDQFNDSATKND